MANEFIFCLLVGVTLCGAVAAMTLRNLVHCALCAAGAFAGLAGIYLRLDAEFVGFAQFLVYVGAVAILIVFAVLLTRGAEIASGISVSAPRLAAGVGAAALVFACILWPILDSPGLQHVAAPEATAPVKKIGENLMTVCIVPLETVGLLLTAALLGAVVIAMRDEAVATPVRSPETTRPVEPVRAEEEAVTTP